jgi:hypothetical protein
MCRGSLLDMAGQWRLMSSWLNCVYKPHFIPPFPDWAIFLLIASEPGVSSVNPNLAILLQGSTEGGEEFVIHLMSIKNSLET